MRTSSAIGVPSVSPSYTPERISTPVGLVALGDQSALAGASAVEVGLDVGLDSGSRGGQPSITTPTPGPCDSPKVVMRNRRPLLEPMAAKYASGPEWLTHRFRGAEENWRC